MSDYSPLALFMRRTGERVGTFVFEGKTITVKTRSVNQGRCVHVDACSREHDALPNTFAPIGRLLRVAPGRYNLHLIGKRGYEDRGSIASLAERLVRYTATNKEN